MKIEEEKWCKAQTSDDNKLLFRFKSDLHRGYVFQWTDLSQIYHEELSLELINQRWIKLNKTIEADSSCQIEILNHGLVNYKQIKVQDADLTLEFHEEEHGVLCRWRFDCDKLSNDQFSSIFIQDLLKVTNFALEKSRKLEEIIKSKDEELKELYENGAALDLKSKKKTAVFKGDIEVKVTDDIRDCLTNEAFYETKLKIAQSEKASKSNESKSKDIPKPKIEALKPPVIKDKDEPSKPSVPLAPKRPKLMSPMKSKIQQELRKRGF